MIGVQPTESVMRKVGLLLGDGFEISSTTYEKKFTRLCLERNFFYFIFSAPTGQMDVWQDCGMPATNIDCAMIWKVVNTQFLILKW